MEKEEGKKDKGRSSSRQLICGHPYSIIRIAHHAPSPIQVGHRKIRSPGTPSAACSVAVDEAAPIFIRFYIGTSRQPWRAGLKRWNQCELPDSNFSLLPIADLVNSSPPYIAAEILLISGLLVLIHSTYCC
jgi:hypothetical protein